MTRKAKEELLTELCDSLREVRRRGREMYSLVGYDGTLSTAVGGLESTAIAAVSHAIGDKGEWVEWFVYENDFGAKGMEAAAADWPSAVPIRSVSDLLDIMEAPEPTAPVLPIDEENVLHYAMRYALGRQTVAPTIILSEITRLWPRIRPATRECMKREVANAIEEGRAGHAMDVRVWSQIQQLSP